jgi:hypothetical protein
MAPLWQALPIHRTTEVHATSRRSAPTSHFLGPIERNRAEQAMIAWQQRAEPAERSQGRKPAEPVALKREP